jgi:hypothetical protein
LFVRLTSLSSTEFCSLLLRQLHASHVGVQANALDRLIELIRLESKPSLCLRTRGLVLLVVQYAGFDTTARSVADDFEVGSDHCARQSKDPAQSTLRHTCSAAWLRPCSGVCHVSCPYWGWVRAFCAAVSSVVRFSVVRCTYLRVVCRADGSSRLLESSPLRGRVDTVQLISWPCMTLCAHGPLPETPSSCNTSHSPPVLVNLPRAPLIRHSCVLCSVC